MPIASGTKLGPYEIIALLGAGGMGEVYRARDTRLGRDVAVKMLTSMVANDKEQIARFAQEARAAGMLNHPNLLTLFDLGTANGAPFIISELLEGETLRERLNIGPVNVRKIVDYALQISNGLAAAHDKGIVHRDLKPENVFITRDDLVKILDFGIAKLMPQQDGGGTFQVAATTPGMVLGTVGYMSPEQVRGENVDQRSDIFSFGAILYEMLSGRRAFRRDSSIETLSAILKEEPPELTELNIQVSPSLERVVRRCLEKNRDRRFQSARDLAFHLESIGPMS
jgi:eukaryotic-like serine/threonine-protein kinase